MSRIGARLAIALLCAGLAGGAFAEGLAIQSFSGTGRLEFNTLNSATNYRIEWASSPAGPWTNFASAAGSWDSIDATQADRVTVFMPMCYRVVALVTNAWLALDVAGDVAFGGVRVGTSATRTLTLLNRGGADLTVSGIDYPEGFSGDWAGVIRAGWTREVSVTFTPVLHTNYSGTVTVHSDAAGGVNTLTVTGKGECDYLVYDLSGGTGVLSYPASHLTDVPSGGWTDEYKTTMLVLRRINAGTFTMGSPTDELGRSTNETPHEVTLSRDFYIGVFEVTQQQWERVRATWPSYFNGLVGYRVSRPVEQVSYNDIRGANAGAGWPASAGVDANSFLGGLRDHTGKDFDLPTEAQWEYACRAGTDTSLNSGKNITGVNPCLNMSEVGRYWYSGGDGIGSNSRDYPPWNGGTAKVGSYLPNAWGLYDMHGNVLEWCLDWDGTYPSAVSNPKGVTSGTHRIARGGSWGDGNGWPCRSAQRGGCYPDGRGSSVGFRVVLPAD